jgi:hypothetical protein
MANLNFDATNVNPASEFVPLPDGWFECTIVAADIGDSRAGNRMLKLRFEVSGDAHPEHAKRLLFGNLNIGHPDQGPREIAERQLSAIAHSVGQLQLADTDDLLGKSLRVKVRSVPAKGEFDASNKILDYKALEGAGVAPTATAKPAATATTAPATTAAKPSWRK